MTSEWNNSASGSFNDVATMTDVSIAFKRLLDPRVDRLAGAAGKRMRQIPGLGAADGKLRFGHVLALQLENHTFNIGFAAADGEQSR